MKSWKEHPHLFANGKFKAKIDYKDEEIPESHWHVDLDNINAFSAPSRIMIGARWALSRYCTLIARRIEDMSEEEFRETTRFHKSVKYDRDVWIEHLKIDCEEDAKNGRVNTGLLSIGVYPFDQKHFDLPDDDPAKVIDIKDLD